jgi:hypothetical protein
MRRAALARGRHWALACSGLATDACAPGAAITSLLLGVRAAGGACVPPGHLANDSSTVCTCTAPFAPSVVSGAPRGHLASGSACAVKIMTRSFASSVVSFPLAQTGEGITECELNAWFTKVRGDGLVAVLC